MCIKFAGGGSTSRSVATDIFNRWWASCTRLIWKKEAAVDYNGLATSPAWGSPPKHTHESTYIKIFDTRLQQLGPWQQEGFWPWEVMSLAYSLNLIPKSDDLEGCAHIPILPAHPTYNMPPLSSLCLVGFLFKTLWKKNYHCEKVEATLSIHSVFIKYLIVE